MSQNKSIWEMVKEAFADSMDRGTVIGIIFILVVVGGLVTLTVRSWTLGSDSEDYDKVCIEGHTYYRANFGGKGFLGIMLNADGKPVACDVNE